MKTIALIMLALVAIQTTEGSIKYSKSGKCPQLIDFIMGMKCPNPCKSDKECPGTKKCCLSDCGGNECMEPIQDAPLDPDCRIPCNKMYDPVCGTDSLTYASWCVLNATVCEKNQRFIKKAYDGECVGEASSKCRSIGKDATCKTELEQVQQKALIGSMHPQCDADGFYLAKQCHPSTGFCHCVDCMGKKLTEPARGRLTEESCQQMRNN